jgi:CRISPR-associated protein Csd1
MILQALYHLAQSENLMADPDYEPKPVAWLVRIDREGKLLGIEGTHYLPPQEGKRKPKPVAKKFAVPKQPTGRSGTKAPPCFLVDNAKYVFGLPTKDKSFPEQEGREKSSWFRELITHCAEATRDEGAKAILALLDEVAKGKQMVTLPEQCVSNDLFAFIFAPDVDLLVHERPKVREYWKAQREEPAPSETAKVQCLVSGRWFEGAALFPLIEKVPGGSPSRIGLVSFNKRAFESYGWNGNENAPISRPAAETCATALNRLLDSSYPDPNNPGTSLPRRNLRISNDTAVCYWAAEKSADSFLGVFASLLEANPEDVAEMYRSVWRGKAPDISDPSAFYALTLTGTQGRAIVRDWFESTVGQVTKRLSEHFADLDIVRNTPKPKDRELPPQMPLGLLVESLALRGDKENVPDHLVASLLHAALSGTPYPFSLLHRVLERTRAEIGDTDWSDMARRDARAAIIKAVLNRRRRFSSANANYREVNREMDTENRNAGYLLGRLMAVMERMQQAALGDINASVVDRFFSGASATPRAVYPRLLKSLRHHASKAKDEPKTAGLARILEKELDSIMANLNDFPAYLNIEEQGLFVLGYHHQRNAIWTKKENRDNVNN